MRRRPCCATASASEDQIDADAKLTSIAGDIDTYIKLAPEETNAEQRNDLLKDLDRELTTRKRLSPSRRRGRCFLAKPITSTRS